MNDSMIFDIRSKAVVLAAGSLNTPAILPSSGLKKNVGCNLKLHPTTTILGLYDKPINMWTGAFRQGKSKWRYLDGRHHDFRVEAFPEQPAIFAAALPWRSGKDHKDAMVRISHNSGTIVLVRENGVGRVKINKYGRAGLQLRIERYVQRSFEERNGGVR